jgi:predicted TPR repeat methyltransferase
MKFEAGDKAGAAADWQQVLREAPDSDAGAAARAHLAELGPAQIPDTSGGVQIADSCANSC